MSFNPLHLKVNYYECELRILLYVKQELCEEGTLDSQIFFCLKFASSIHMSSLVLSWLSCTHVNGQYLIVFVCGPNPNWHLVYGLTLFSLCSCWDVRQHSCDPECRWRSNRKWVDTCVRSNEMKWINPLTHTQKQKKQLKLTLKANWHWKSNLVKTGRFSRWEMV